MKREWTESEIKYLIDNYHKTSNDELSKFLNRSEKSIRSKSAKLKLRKIEYIPKDGRDWSESEIEFLIDKFSDTRNEDIANHLKRSMKSITKKAHSLYLKKSKDHKSKMIGKRNKKIGRDLNNDTLKQISKQYKSRAEFQMCDNSAYQSARKKGILDEICSHMVKQSFSIPQLILKSILSQFLGTNLQYNTRQVINPYEIDIYFPDYKLAFEYNGKGWHKNETIDKNDICEKKSIKLFTIIENNRRYEEDIKNQIISILPQINDITNKNTSEEDILNINIDEKSFEGILDEEKIISICEKYTEYSSFRKENINLYNRLRKLKILDKYTKHMKRTIIKWNDERALNEIKKYVFMKDFIQNSLGCYHWVKKNCKEFMLEPLILKQNKKLKYRKNGTI